MSAHAWITLGIVIGAIALFASEKVRIDLVALIVLALFAAARASAFRTGMRACEVSFMFSKRA